MESLLYLFALLLMLVIGIFIITRNPIRSVSITSAASFFCGALFFVSFLIADLTPYREVEVAMLYLGFIPFMLIQVSWFLNGVLYLKHLKKDSVLVWIMFYLATFFNISLLLLVLFSDFIFLPPKDSENAKFITTSGSILLPIYLTLQSMASIYLYVKLSRYVEKKLSKLRSIVLIIQTLLAEIAFSFLAINHIVEIGIEVPDLLLLILVISILLMVFFAIVQFDIFIEEQNINSKDFVSKFTIILLLVVFYKFYFDIVPGLIGLDASIILALVLLIVTHLIVDWGYEAVYQTLIRKKPVLPIIKHKSVSFALHNIDNLRLLQDKVTALTDLKGINKISKDTGSSPLQVLQDEIKATIKTMKPEVQMKRTRRVLRYEILRMIAFEGSKESSILWDLGFDTRSFEKNLKTSPRFQINSNSEYTARSINSYRRLKQEAIEEFTLRFIKRLSS